MTSIPGQLPTETFPVARSISNAAPTGRFTRLFAALVEDAAAPPLEIRPEAGSLNLESQDFADPSKADLAIETCQIAHVAVDVPCSWRSITIFDDSTRQRIWSEAEAQTVPGFFGEGPESIIPTSELVGETLAGYTKLINDLSADLLLPKPEGHPIPPLTIRAVLSGSDARILFAEATDPRHGMVAPLVLDSADVEPMDIQDAEKPVSTDRTSTRTVRLRIDKDEWTKASINPRPLRIEIPVDLEIPSQPQPVRSDTEKQLLALTEMGSRAQTILTVAAIRKRVDTSDSSYGRTALSSLRGASTRAKLSFDTTVRPTLELHETSQTYWNTATSVRTATRQSLNQPLLADTITANIRLSHGAQDEHRSAPERLAIPAVQAAQPMAIVSKSAWQGEGAVASPNVRFSLEDWMPGQTVSHLRVALDPVELGGVRVHLSNRGGELFARIVVEQPAALPVVTANFTALRNAMAERGIQFSGFSVTLAGAASAVGLPADARPRIESSERRAENRSEEKATKKAA